MLWPNGDGRIRSWLNPGALPAPPPPGVAPLPPVFRRWDGVAFAAALSRWAMASLPAGSSVLAVDGKARRGLPGMRLVAVYAMAAGPLVGQKGVR